MRHSRHVFAKFRRDHYRRHLRRRELLLRASDESAEAASQNSFAERLRDRASSDEGAGGTSVWQQQYGRPNVATPPDDRVTRSTRELPDEARWEVAAGRTEHQVAAARSAARASRPTGEERALHREILAAGTWYDSVRVFHDTVARGAHPTAQTFRVLMDSVLTARARDAAMSAFGAAFEDLVAEGSNERWEATLEERRVLARLCVQQEEIHQHESSLAIQPTSRMLQEGADDALVAALEQSMRKHQAVPPADVVADMSLLRISWTAALRLLRFAREISGGLLPPSEMYVRAMDLMTAVGKTSFGSRPWSTAIALYHELRSSGYHVPLGAQIAAQQALWRSCHHTWIRPTAASGGTISDGLCGFVWEASLRLFRDHVARADDIVGDDGCRLFEASIRTMVHCGRWDVAIELLSKMELSASDVTHRLLVPTPSCIAEATAGALRAGHIQHALALTQLFESYGYQWRTLPPETLRDVLTAARSSLRVNSSIAERLLEHVLVVDRDRQSGLGGKKEEEKEESTVGRGEGGVLLDRGVAVACLGLVSNGRLPWSSAGGLPPRWECALQLVASYDSNVWPSHPLERKLELAAVFRAVRRVALLQTKQDDDETATRTLEVLDRLVSATESSDAPNDAPLRLHRMEVMVQEQWLERVFGRSSREWEWWEDSLVHRIGRRVSWVEASRLHDRLVRRGRHHTKFLPVPMRQVRQELSLAVWSYYDPRLLRSQSARGAVPDDAEQRTSLVDVDEADQEDFLEWAANLEGATTLESIAGSRLSQCESSIGDAITWLQSVSKGDPGVRHVVGALQMKRAALLCEKGETAAAKQESDAALYTLGLSAQKMLASRRSSLLLDTSTALQLPVEPQVRDLLSSLHHQLRRAAWSHQRSAANVDCAPRLRLTANSARNKFCDGQAYGEEYRW